MKHSILCKNAAPFYFLLSLFLFVFYVPSQAQWTIEDDMPIPAAAIDPVGWEEKIYVFGGKMTEIVSSNDVLVFDPEAESWTSAGKLPDSLEAIAVEVIGGKFYLIGGHSHPDFIYRTEIMTYDPSTNVFDTVGHLPTPKAWYTTAAVDGKIYVMGGDNGTQSINNVDIFDTQTKTWAAGPPLLTARAGLSADTLDGKIYVTGGGAGVAAFNTVEIFDPMAPSSGWTYGPATLSIERAFHAAKNVGGRLYVFGGAKSFSTPYINSVEYLDEESGSWKQYAPLNFARRELGAAILDDSVAYVIGGVTGNFGAGTYLAKVEKNDTLVSSNEPGSAETMHPSLRVSPNPFNSKTTIFYQLAQADKIQLAVCDPLGRLVRIETQEWQTAGEHAIELNIGVLPKGIYTCLLQTGSGAVSHTRMLVH